MFAVQGKELISSEEQGMQDAKSACIRLGSASAPPYTDFYGLGIMLHRSPANPTNMPMEKPGDLDTFPYFSFPVNFLMLPCIYSTYLLVKREDCHKLHLICLKETRRKGDVSSLFGLAVPQLTATSCLLLSAACDKPSYEYSLKYTSVTCNLLFYWVLWL